MEKIDEEDSVSSVADRETETTGEDRNSVGFLPKDAFRSSHFSVLSKIDEVDESRVRSPLTSSEGDEGEDGDKATQSPHVMWKSEDEIIHIEKERRIATRERPKSANSAVNGKPWGRKQAMRRSCSAGAVHTQGKTGPKSVLKSNSSSSSRNSDWESNSECSLTSVLGRPRSAGSKPRNSRKGTSSWNDACLWDYYPTRPRSACGMRLSCYSENCFADGRASWLPCDENCEKYLPRKSSSNPNLTRGKCGATSDLQIGRFKRSLKLLGLEVADFGIFDSRSQVSQYRRTRTRAKRAESTFSTKIAKRSISLEGLKEQVREAWLDDRLDSSHRKLLAQAAYEEWYFRKAEEAHQRLINERAKNKIMKEKLEIEFQTRKLKAEEQFRKWVEGKRTKWEVEKKSKASALGQFRVVKTKEEVDVAYRRWKKEKDKQREERQKLERVERERKENVEKQKEEKRAMAERAFIEWKRKVEESEKTLAEANQKRERRKKEMEIRKKQQEKKTSFQMWKEMKDRELMVKRQESRKAARVAKAVRSAQLEERMYEAEQAFEEWLEKIELRESLLKSKTMS